MMTNPPTANWPPSVRWEPLSPWQRAASKRKFEKEAQRRFFYHLNEAHKAMYDAGIENKGAILSMNIKDLYQYFSGPQSLHWDDKE